MRKQPPEEHVETEKWAIPYADLLTLLLAFFVVMYSLSSVNEAKFRVLAESINEAFNGTGKVIEPVTPAQPARQVPLPDQARAANATPIALIRVPVAPHHLPPPGHEGAASTPSPGDDVQRGGVASATSSGNHAQRAAVASTIGPGSDLQQAGAATAASPGKSGRADHLQAIANDVSKALKPWIDSNKVIIRKTKLWLEIEIRTDVLFPSGEALLAEPARNVLDGVAGVLGRFPNPIRIEGYTDNRPIDTWKFPSNWELSAARAGSVARLFSDHGVDPHRIGIFGWGEYHPVASNATPEGRNRNRRIAIVVLSGRGTPGQDSGDQDRSLAIAATSMMSARTSVQHMPAAMATAPKGRASAGGAAADTAGAPPAAAGAALHNLR